MNLKPLMLAPILASVALCSALTEAQSGWKVFFDPSLETPQLRLTSRQQSVLQADAYALLSRVQNLCRYDSRRPEVEGAAQGSFTRTQSNQIAYSVKLCNKQSYDPSSRISSTSDSLYGLFVYEGERLIDSFTSKVPGNLYSTRDINQNGRSEIVYFEESSLIAAVRMFEMNMFVTEFDSNGNLQRIGQRERVQQWEGNGTGFEYAISVFKGRRPVFKADIKTLDVSSGYPVVVNVQRNVPISVLF
jgi:hypothetical protein